MEYFRKGSCSQSSCPGPVTPSAPRRSCKSPNKEGSLLSFSALELAVMVASPSRLLFECLDETLRRASRFGLQQAAYESIWAPQHDHPRSLRSSFVLDLRTLGVSYRKLKLRTSWARRGPWSRKQGPLGRAAAMCWQDASWWNRRKRRGCARCQ